jgi:universal stress protein E
MEPRNILVAIRREPEAARVLAKVARLVTPGCRVHVLRVRHDPRAELRGVEVDERWAHRTVLMQAEQEALEALIDPWRARMPGVAGLVVWHKRFHRGVLDVARELGADLIVKQAETTSRIAEVVRTPDDWHLLREAACAVLLVKTGLWIEQPTVLAAVDALDDAHQRLSGQVLAVAAALAGQLGGTLELASAYPTLQPWPGDLGTAYDYGRLRNAMLADMDARQRSLLGPLVADTRRHVLEGEPAVVLERLADERAAEIVVLGTAARRGVPALMLGNTSEALLHRCHRDVLAVRDPECAVPSRA